MKAGFAGFLAVAATVAVAGAVPFAAPASAQAATAAKPAFVPAGFTPPVAAQGPGFRLEPLGPKLVRIDYAAYIASITHLQKTFTRSIEWPHERVTDADALRDMESEQARFRNRESFAYAVLTPDGTRERGCVYVSPSPIPGQDAVVRLWVTQAEYDAGFDAVLYAWVTGWMKRDWPFRRVAYPGRSIAWARWDAMVAAAGPKP